MKSRTKELQTDFLAALGTIKCIPSVKKLVYKFQDIPSSIDNYFWKDISNTSAIFENSTIYENNQLHDILSNILTKCQLKSDLTIFSLCTLDFLPFKTH